MANNVTRAVKSAKEWTEFDLTAFNIIVSFQLPMNFFLPASDPPTQSHQRVDPAILNSSTGDTDDDDPTILSDHSAAYLNHLNMASKPTQQCFVDDFASETLKLLGFNQRHTVVCTGYVIPILTTCNDTDPNIHTDDSYEERDFPIRNNYPVAQTDVCILHRRRTTFVLLVVTTQQLEINGYTNNPEAQLIASAIAAFQFNNSKRKELALAPLDTMIIPCIVMDQTKPTFYLVPVTRALSEAIITGLCPIAPTYVQKYRFIMGGDLSIGMEELKYRKQAFESLLAFKAVARSHWLRILEGVY